MNVVVIGSRARRERKHTVATKTKQENVEKCGSSLVAAAF